MVQSLCKNEEASRWSIKNWCPILGWISHRKSRFHHLITSFSKPKYRIGTLVRRIWLMKSSLRRKSAIFPSKPRSSFPRASVPSIHATAWTWFFEITTFPSVTWPRNTKTICREKHHRRNCKRIWSFWTGSHPILAIFWIKRRREWWIFRSQNWVNREKLLDSRTLTKTHKTRRIIQPCSKQRSLASVNHSRPWRSTVTL